MALTAKSASVLRQARQIIRPLRLSNPTQAASFRRLLSSVALLEQREGKLNVASLAAVTAAQKLGGPVTGFVAGSKGKTLAEEVAKVKGIDKVVYVENEAYDKVRSAMHGKEMRCSVHLVSFGGRMR